MGLGEGAVLVAPGSESTSRTNEGYAVRTTQCAARARLTTILSFLGLLHCDPELLRDLRVPRRSPCHWSVGYRGTYDCVTRRKAVSVDVQQRGKRAGFSLAGGKTAPAKREQVIDLWF